MKSILPSIRTRLTYNLVKRINGYHNNLLFSINILTQPSIHLLLICVFIDLLIYYIDDDADDGDDDNVDDYLCILRESEETYDMNL